MMRFPEFRGFVGGYLHADWDLEADTLADLARNFAADAGPNHTAALVRELDELLGPRPVDWQIRLDLTTDFGFDPLWRDRDAAQVIAEFRSGLVAS